MPTDGFSQDETAPNILSLATVDTNIHHRKFATRWLRRAWALYSKNVKAKRGERIPLKTVFLLTGEISFHPMWGSGLHHYD